MNPILAAFLKEGEVGWMGRWGDVYEADTRKGESFSPFLLLRYPLLKSLFFVTIRSFFLDLNGPNFNWAHWAEVGWMGGGEMFTRLPVVKGRESSCLGDCGHISHISHPIGQKCRQYFGVEKSKECLMSCLNLSFHVSALTNHPCII